MEFTDLLVRATPSSGILHQSQGSRHKDFAGNKFFGESVWGEIQPERRGSVEQETAATNVGGTGRRDVPAGCGSGGLDWRSMLRHYKGTALSLALRPDAPFLGQDKLKRARATSRELPVYSR
jgi:hypothetical protein